MPATAPGGAMGAFADPDSLTRAVLAARAHGFTDIEPFSPFRIPALDDVLGLRTRAVPLAALIGGLLGAIGFFLMQAYAQTEGYVYLIGGRPLFSWPSYILPSFAVGVGAAAASAVLTMLWCCGLPRLNHPLFDQEDFGRVTRDGFFLRLGHGRDNEAAGTFLASHGAMDVRELGP